jgi:hypothetical protein
MPSQHDGKTAAPLISAVALVTFFYVLVKQLWRLCSCCTGRFRLDWNFHCSSPDLASSHLFIAAHQSNMASMLAAHCKWQLVARHLNASCDAHVTVKHAIIHAGRHERYIGLLLYLKCMLLPNVAKIYSFIECSVHVSTIR